MSSTTTAISGKPIKRKSIVKKGNTLYVRVYSGEKPVKQQVIVRPVYSPFREV